MKWKMYQLGMDDAKAKEHILENVAMGANEGHVFTRTLLTHLAPLGGMFTAIAFESLDVDVNCLYKYGTYSGGKGLAETLQRTSVSWLESPRRGLMEFVRTWLRSSQTAVVLCENWLDSRERLAKLPPRESRILFYRNEVYHVLTHEDSDNLDLIESTLRESEDHWSTGVCSSATEVPIDEILAGAFFDAVIASSAHVFVPAFDGEGYLLWSLGGK